jgi:ABC-type dipeptide/oligopeptide/nickel transport systems, permease components
MFSYFFKRLFQSIIVMIVVAFVSFSLFNFVGDPVNSMTGEDASDERRAEVREVLGLNDPVYVQFSRFFRQCNSGRFWNIISIKKRSIRLNC